MNAATISKSANKTAAWKLAQGNIGFQFFSYLENGNCKIPQIAIAKYKPLALD